MVDDAHWLSRRNGLKSVLRGSVAARRESGGNPFGWLVSCVFVCLSWIIIVPCAAAKSQKNANRRRKDGGQTRRRRSRKTEIEESSWRSQPPPPARRRTGVADAEEKRAIMRTPLATRPTRRDSATTRACAASKTCPPGPRERYPARNRSTGSCGSRGGHGRATARLSDGWSKKLGQ